MLVFLVDTFLGYAYKFCSLEVEIIVLYQDTFLLNVWQISSCILILFLQTHYKDFRLVDLRIVNKTSQNVVVSVQPIVKWVSLCNKK